MPFNPLFFFHNNRILPYLIIFSVALFKYSTAYSQLRQGTLYGTISDGSTNFTLLGVSISGDSSAAYTESLQGGRYRLGLAKGIYNIYFRLPGFQTKLVEKVKIENDVISHIDIFLLPLSETRENYNRKESTPVTAGNVDSAVRVLAGREAVSIIYNPLNNSEIVTDVIKSPGIRAGTDKNTLQLLNRLNGVIVRNNPSNHTIQSIQISGLGDRYNQALFNGAPLNSSSTINRSYPLELLPAEAVDQVTLYKASQPFLPADFAGGTIDIRTKDMSDRNFYLVQVGTGFSSDTRGKDFLGDQRRSSQVTSFPGKQRNLPASFPTTRSQYDFTQRNVQEKIDFSKLLNNNLAPVNYGRSSPNDRILLGLGDVFQVNKELKISVLGFLNHIKEELIETGIVQVYPDIATPFLPPNTSRKIIRSQSSDIKYHYSAQLGAVLNTSFFWRRNKISVRNYIGNQLLNTLNTRTSIIKPDEDTLARDGLRITTEQRKFWYAQIAGDHSFGEKGKFAVDWQITYNYNQQQNPDERNFLLRRDSLNPDLFEIARPQSPNFDPNPSGSGVAENNIASNFTNSSRLWRQFTEHNLTASLNLKIPINIFDYTQILKGGLYLNSITRNFTSDLLLVKGTGFYTLNNLLAPERYFPGGLSVVNFYNNTRAYDTKRGNYYGASNIGALYINLENRFLENIYLQWGFRLESDSRSTATVLYQYLTGYKNPQRVPIDDNSRQVHFNLLPSANLMYSPVKSLQLSANYSRTVNRPLLQELNAYRYYDAGSFLVRSGNQFLDNSIINNYGTSAKWLYKAGTHILLSGFYKQIDQPIEEIITPYYTGNMFGRLHNMPPAVIKGLQADVRLKLNDFTNAPWLSNVSLFASGVILKSKVEEGPLRAAVVAGTEEHTITGTPNHSFNTGIILQEFHLPELSIVYSKTGDYISMLGTGSSVNVANGNRIKSIPDYRVRGREQLDIQIAQLILKSRIQLIAGISNLLSSPYIEYQDLNGNKKFDDLLSVTKGIDKPGFYISGTDNGVMYIKSQRNFYARLSYRF